MLKPKDVISAEQNRRDEAKNQQAEGDTLSDLAGLSCSWAKEVVEVLIEKALW